MDEPELAVKGVNGQIQLFRDRVEITRHGALGFLTQGHKGAKSIFIRQISSVQFKDAGLATNGYIQFAFMGGQETKGGLFNATQDENSVMFNRSQRKAFTDLRDEVTRRISASAGSSPPAGSVADELAKLVTLRDQGILTGEEFDVQKRRLLG
jgi:hypothetical protein